MKHHYWHILLLIIIIGLCHVQYTHQASVSCDTGGKCSCGGYGTYCSYCHNWYYYYHYHCHNYYYCPYCYTRNCAAGRGTCTHWDICNKRCQTCECLIGPVYELGYYEGSCCSSWKCGSGGNRYWKSDYRVCSGRHDKLAVAPGIPNGNSGSNTGGAGRGNCIEPNKCRCTDCYGHGFGTVPGPNQVCSHFRCNGRDDNDLNVCSGHGACGCAPNPNVVGQGNVLGMGDAGYDYETVLEACTSPCDCRCNLDPVDSLPLYKGNDCQYPICFGYGSNEEEVCNKRGTCDTPGVCTCVNNGAWGYTGEQCETPKCANKAGTASCGGPGRGTCTRKEGTNQNECVCNTGYTGNECQYSICDGRVETHPNVCNGALSLAYLSRGDCSAPDTCINCATGWTGTSCEIHMCNGYPHTDFRACGHGSCVTNQVTQWCECENQYWIQDGSGNCSIPLCDGKNHANHPSLVCSGHGQCNPSGMTDNTCVCEAGYSGQFCEIWACEGDTRGADGICNDRGHCVEPDQCECQNYGDWGYNGTNCEVIKCDGKINPEACGDHGTCTVDGGNNHCTCNEGWTGTLCDMPICEGRLATDPLVCNGNGTCIGFDLCVNCTEGWTGENCDIPMCFGVSGNLSSVCHGHGTCVEDTPPYCQCNEGYTTASCQFYHCHGISKNDSSVCSSHGNCTSINTCACDGNWGGEKCDIPKCFGTLSTANDVCSSHGTCDGVNSCSCISNYTTANCSIHMCYGLMPNDTNVCHGHGVCTQINQCECDSSWEGHECQVGKCFGISPIQAAVCSGNGECVDKDSCSCHSGYSGEKCSLHSCFDVLYTNSSVCSGHGKCKALNYCDCQSGYTSSNCSDFFCFGKSPTDPLVCSNHGECIDFNTCSCNDTYAGVACNFPVCYGEPSYSTQVCSGHGSCGGPNQCEYCSGGWTGDQCDEHTCFQILHSNNSVCSSHGSCEGPNTCNCQSDYTGESCLIPICFSKSAEHTMVCSGHGDCIGVNTCQCNTGYAGDECQHVECFNISAADANVCHGHGTCSSIDQCDCEKYYEHANCSAFHCHELGDCLGNGECIGPNTCNCFNHYSGANCSLAACFDTAATDSNVCSGHGKCVGANTCVCDEGVSGVDCSNVSCFGIYSTNASTCSGHGTCVNVDKCVCQTPFVTKNCSRMLCRNSNAITKTQADCNEDCNLDSDGNCETSLASSFVLNGKEMVGNFYLLGRTSNVIDCNKVLSEESLAKIGRYPVCYWDSLTSTNFTIKFGPGATIKDKDKLQVDLLPFDSDNVFTTVEASINETERQSTIDAILYEKPFPWWAPVAGFLAVMALFSVLYYATILCVNCCRRAKVSTIQSIKDESLKQSANKRLYGDIEVSSSGSQYDNEDYAHQAESKKRLYANSSNHSASSIQFENTDYLDDMPQPNHDSTTSIPFRFNNRVEPVLDRPAVSNALASTTTSEQRSFEFRRHLRDTKTSVGGSTNRSIRIHAKQARLAKKKATSAARLTRRQQ